VEAKKANATAISTLEEVIAFTPIARNENDKLVKSLMALAIAIFSAS
jgi:hypothetical protein